MAQPERHVPPTQPGLPPDAFSPAVLLLPPLMYVMGWLVCWERSLGLGWWHKPPCPTNYIIKKIAIKKREKVQF